MEKRCKLKTKSDQIVKVVLVLLVGGTLVALAYFSLFIKNENKDVSVDPLPFSGSYDKKDIEDKIKVIDNFILLSEEESRTHYEVIQPNPEESKNRNMFTGAPR